MDKTLSELYGERISEDWCERVAYSRDLGEIPAVLRSALKIENVPDLVARPSNARDVAAAMEYAKAGGVPVTPRGSASSGFFNAVPVKKGLCLDLCGLDQIEDVDQEAGTVTVGAGCRWLPLDRHLRRQGWAVRTYPTSAPTATVGGWINMEGYGVGSLAYSALIDQVVGMEVVFASGEIRWITPDSTPPTTWFAGSDGTLGVVTKVTLRIRRVPESEKHWLVSFADSDALGRAAVELASGYAGPYNMSFLHSSYFDLQRRMGHAAPDGDVLAVDYEDSAEAVAEGRQRVAEAAARHGGTILPDRLAEAEWEQRFRHLSLKRLGPSVLAAEDWIGPDRLGEYQAAVARLGRRLKTSFYTYGTIVGTQRMSVFTGYLTDRRKPLSYLIALSVTCRLHEIAGRLGGRPLGVGLWNTPYLPGIYSPEELTELRRRKKFLDPAGLLNPGKHYEWPALLSPGLFSLGANMGSLLQRFASGQ